MFVVSKRNIIIPSTDGSQKYRLPRDYMGTVPDWVAKTAYFKALVADGKVLVSESSKDKDIEKAAKGGKQ